MSGDGSDLDVSKQALGQIADGITKTLAELKELGMVGTASMGRGFSDLSLSGLETGHDGLTSSFNAFCERWEWGVRALVQQGNDFAANVGLSAGLVHEQDQYIQGRPSGPWRRPRRRPRPCRRHPSAPGGTSSTTRPARRWS
ncbi:hypothetical protein [Streptomyces sp. C]|uniref:hypothetical protein n=1 Tax=Streptomyces sp. C TaxID=253839 RepID=UPI0001B587A3|nr:predicted protein [Streptomyces sp. C]